MYEKEVKISDDTALQKHIRLACKNSKEVNHFSFFLSGLSKRNTTSWLIEVAKLPSRYIQFTGISLFRISATSSVAPEHDDLITSVNMLHVASPYFTSYILSPQTLKLMNVRFTEASI